MTEDQKIRDKRKERKEHFLNYLLDQHMPASQVEFATALLIESIDRNSEETNRLTGRIKTLTWALVLIAAAGLLVSLYAVLK